MRSRPKWYRFLWPELAALPIALIVAGGAYAFWIVGVMSLAGYAHQRFDGAMFDATIKAELVLVVPIWLFLRAADLCARVLSRPVRSDLRSSAPAGLRAASQV